jgi:hypothetical protein
MSSKLATVWTQGIHDDKKKADFEGAIRNSTVALGRLKEIIEVSEEAIYSQMSRDTDYSQTDWAYKAAHRNGQLEMLRKFKDLLAFLEG